MVREGLITHPESEDKDDAVKSTSESELKEIVINRHLYVGKVIIAAMKELERRGISLTESERQQQEANKQKRIEAAKRNSKKK